MKPTHSRNFVLLVLTVIMVEIIPTGSSSSSASSEMMKFSRKVGGNERKYPRFSSASIHERNPGRNLGRDEMIKMSKKSKGTKAEKAKKGKKEDSHTFDFDNLDTSAEALQTASADWGGEASRVPIGVYNPTSAREVARFLRGAAEERLLVAAQGQRHSAKGQAQVLDDGRDGIVLNMTGIDFLGKVQEDGHASIWVGAGATWRQIALETSTYGYLPPTFTDYIDLSVGGTLAVGGIGSQSPFHGLQTDNVLALKVATTSGKIKHCSNEYNKELFEAVLGGLGQYGVITHARLALKPAPEMVRYIRLLYESLPTMINDMFTLVDQGLVSGVEGFAVPSDPAGLVASTGNAFPNAELPADVGPYAFMAEFYFDASEDVDPLEGLDPIEVGGINDLTLPTFAYLARLDAVEATLRESGLWFAPHPWVDVFVPRSVSSNFILHELSLLGPTDVLGPILIYPVKNNVINTTNTPLPTDDGDESILFSLLRNAIPFERATELQIDNAAIYERLLTVGGTGYSITSIPLNPLSWQQHFGDERYLELETIKKKYDPCGLLAPGQFVFEDTFSDDEDEHKCF